MLKKLIDDKADISVNLENFAFSDQCLWFAEYCFIVNLISQELLADWNFTLRYCS